MDSSDAYQIIKALADGIDPTTGEIFDDGSPYQHPVVIRALFAASFALEREIRRKAKEQRLPSKAGTSWSEREDTELVEAFKNGVSITELAKHHRRTIGSIQSRLVKHGLIESELFTKSDN